METFLFYLHVSAAGLIGLDAHKRGRNFIVWMLATLFVSILVTWPLLYILPRLNDPALQHTQPAEVRSPTIAANAAIATQPKANALIDLFIIIWAAVVGIGLLSVVITYMSR